MCDLCTLMSKVEMFIFYGTPPSAVSIDSVVRNGESGQFLLESCLTFIFSRAYFSVL